MGEPEHVSFVSLPWAPECSGRALATSRVRFVTVLELVACRVALLGISLQ